MGPKGESRIPEESFEENGVGKQHVLAEETISDLTTSESNNSKKTSRRERAKRTLDSAIRELEDFLEQEQPSEFSPSWLYSNHSGLWKFLIDASRSDEGDVQWRVAIEQLPKKWQEKWTYLEQAKARKWNFEEAVKALTNLLKEKDPPFFRPLWIRQQYPALSEYVEKNLRTPEGEVDWDRLVKGLSEDLREKWEPVHGNIEDKAKKLEKILISKDPEKFSPWWLYKNARGISKWAYKNLQSEPEKVDYDKLIKLLSPEWQERWSYRWQPLVATLDHEVIQLQEALSSHKPTYFNTNWMYHRARKVYVYAKRHLKNSEGIIEWQKLISLLPPEWQKLWSYKESPSKRKFKQIEEKSYVDPAEIDSELNKYGDKLYTLMAPEGKEDRIIRDSIIDDLLNLTHKGNIVAKSRLEEYLKTIVNEWIDTRPSFSMYKHAPEDLDRVIQRCIYLRDEGRLSSFLTYLYVSLKFGAKGLPHVNSVDDFYPSGSKRKIENVSKNPETGEIKLYNGRN